MDAPDLRSGEVRTSGVTVKARGTRPLSVATARRARLAVLSLLALLALCSTLLGAGGRLPARDSAPPVRPAGLVSPPVLAGSRGLGTFVTPVDVGAAAPSDAQLAAFVSAVHTDLVTFWTAALAPRGVTPRARVDLFQEAQQPILSTSCGTIPANVGPFYCGGDATIYLGMGFAGFVWAQVGDAALVEVVAHEFGHGVQQSLGIVAVAGSPSFELQADCLGGAFGGDAANRGLLQDGDIAEARQLSRLVGDDGASADPHGTADQREQAWLQGFSGGPPACLA